MPHTLEERAKLDRIARLIERRPRANLLSRYHQGQYPPMAGGPCRRPLSRRIWDALLTALAWLIVAGAVGGALLWMWVDKRR